MSKNRKQNKKGKAYLCSPEAWPGPVAQPAHWPSASRRCPRASRTGVWPTRAHRRAATPLACLPSPLPARRAGRRRGCRPDPVGLLTFPLAFSLALSHRARTLPSPPLAIAAATVSPSSLRHAQELRLLALKLSAEPRKPERPVEPSPSPSSPPATVDPHRRSVDSRASPEPLSTPAEPP